MKIKNSKLRHLKSVLTFLVLLAGILAGAAMWLAKPSAAAWYGDTWGYRKKLTIDHTKVSGGADLTNFPILVSLTDGSLSKAQSNGNDILFTASDGTTKLDHEIEKFTQKTGTLVAWVRIPTLSYTTDTVIYMYYGNFSAPSQQNKTGVWDANYVMIHHLGESSGTHYDSKGSNNSNYINVTQQGTNIGKADGADEFNSTGNKVTVPDNDILTFSGDFTVEAWVKFDQLAVAKGRTENIVTKKSLTNPYDEYYLSQPNVSGSNYLRFATENSTGTAFWADFTGALATGTWYHVVGTKTSNVLKIYINGSSTTGDTFTGSTFNGNNDFFIGDNDNDNPPVGVIDEVRLSSASRSDGWIATTYNTISNNATFFSVKGNEEKNRQPVLYFSFNEGYGTTTTDSSPAKITGIFSGASVTVSNPGFETAGGGGADVFAGWVESASDGTITRTTTVGEYRSGVAAAKLTSGSGQNTTITTNTITVTPLTTYNLTFWTRGDGTNAGKYSVWDNTHSANITARISTGVTGTSYTSVTTSFTVPAGCVSIGVMLWSPPSTGGIAYFDDVALNANPPTWQSEDMCVSGKCLYFNGSYTSLTIATASANVQSISFWEKNASSSGTIPLLKLSSSANVSITNGNTVTATGFTSPTIYINGQAGKIVSPNVWNHIVITDTGTTNANALVLGTIDSATFFQGFLDEFKLYDYQRTAAQVKLDYNSKSGASSSGTNVSMGSQNTDALNQGLVGYWKMDEATWSGTLNEVVDSSGNGNNGTAQGAISGKAFPTAGKFGNGGYFDGVDDYVDTGINSSLDLTQSVSMSIWVKLNSVTGLHELVDKYFDAYSLTNNNQWFYLNYRDEAGNLHSVGCPTPVTTGVWYHVVGTIDSHGKTNIYLNGNLTRSLDFVGNSIASRSTHPLTIGNRGSSDSFTNGTIDDVRIYNRALTPAEVSQLYNWAPGPMGYWKMDENQGQTAYDSSGNNYSGTLGASTSVGSDDPIWGTGKFDSSLFYNGGQYVNLGDNLDQAGDYTLETWFKDTGTTLKQEMFRKGSGAGKKEYSLRLNETQGNIYFIVYNSIDTPYLWCYSSTSVSLVDNKWHHVAATLSGSTCNVYVDGKLSMSSSSVTGSRVTDTTENLNFGRNPGNADYFTGYLDDMRIYNYARTPAQIVEDMNGGHPAPGSPIGSAVAHWDFNEGYGTTVNNTGNSGSVLNGTLGTSTATPVWSNNGKFDKALSFDGNDDYVKVTDSTNSPLDITQQISLSAWIKSTGTQVQYALVIAKDKGAGSYIPYELSFNGASNDNIDFSVSDGAFQPNVYSNMDIPPNVWTHVVGTYDGTVMKIYINGVLQTQTNNQNFALTTNNNDLEIGGKSTASGATFNGLIDEVKIYNFALTADQVLAEYNQGQSMVLGSLSDTSSLSGGSIASNSASASYCIPGDSSVCTPPIGEWNFEEKSGNTVADTSGNGSAGTWYGTGTPHWIAGKIGNTGKFNGSDDYVQVPSSDKYDLKFPMSISVWFKTSSTGQQTIFSKRDTTYNSGTSPRGYVVDINSNHLRFYRRTTNGGTDANPSVESNTVVTDGKWHYGVITLSGTSAIVYIDGVLDNSTTITSTDITLSGIDQFIGRAWRGSAGWQYYFSGLVDQVKIYNYRRTRAQIAWEYNRGIPVAQYDFDECQGTVIHDTAPKSDRTVTPFNGTLSIGGNGAQSGTGNCGDSDTSHAWNNGTTGKYGASFNGDGNDDVVAVSDAAPIRLSYGSVSMWVKPKAYPNSGTWMALINKGDFNSNYNDYSFYFTGPSSTFCQVVGGASTYRELCQPWTEVPLNTWTHVVMTWDGINVTTYLNGKLRSQNTMNGIPDTTGSNLYIGASGPGSNYNFNGQLDDVRLYNYALTPTQVQTLFNNSSAVSF